ncbi:hypothetical protein M0R45_027503 [Rubus argutus]|uniref:Uncharacterized protein n=1 Tax=Rubus argutus TaxID=59490 RepID=A0AAW1X0N7_RUBAR
MAAFSSAYLLLQLVLLFGLQMRHMGLQKALSLEAKAQNSLTSGLVTQRPNALVNVLGHSISQFTDHKPHLWSHPTTMWVWTGPKEAPLEAASACPGVYAKGAYPGYAGDLLVDTTTGASYNANGLNGKSTCFLLCLTLNLNLFYSCLRVLQSSDHVIDLCRGDTMIYSLLF